MNGFRARVYDDKSRPGFRGIFCIIVAFNYTTNHLRPIADKLEDGYGRQGRARDGCGREGDVCVG